MSWGRGEARGAPPLMPDTLIHTNGEQLLLSPPSGCSQPCSHLTGPNQTLQATHWGAAGATQGSTHAVDDHSAMGIGQLTESSIHTSTTMGGLIYRGFGVLQPRLQSQIKRSKKAERHASQRSLPVHFSEKYNVVRRGDFL